VRRARPGDDAAVPPFFDPPPSAPGPEPRNRRSDHGHGPPRNVLPGVVPVEAVLARTDEVVLSVASLQAYATGVTFELVVLARTPERGPGPLGGPHGLSWTGLGPGAPPDGLRLGVAFPDGRRATSPDEAWSEDGPDDAVRIRPQGGGGSDTFHHIGIWVTPLPPAGPLALVCEWPAQGIPETRVVVDGAAVAEAAGRARTVLSEDHLLAWDAPDDEDGTDGDGGWARYARVR
jgi:hypothetical protein